MYNTYYNYLQAYNSFNDAKLIANTLTGRITPIDFAKEIINLSISNSYYMAPLNKEICKAFVSSIRFA